MHLGLKKDDLITNYIKIRIKQMDFLEFCIPKMFLCDKYDFIIIIDPSIHHLLLLRGSGREGSSLTRRPCPRPLPPALPGGGRASRVT